jgi:accessory gene regulator B
MFYKTSIFIADILEQQNKFIAEDKEIYRYGIQQGLNLALNILTTIIIGYVFDMFFPSIILLTCYMPLRSFCGGYHAKTHLRCYVYSIIMISCILLVVKHFVMNIIINESIVFASLIVIFILAPVEDNNKRLDYDEKQKFRKKAYIIAIIEVTIDHIFVFFKITFCFQIVSMSFFSLSILMIIGQIKNHIQNNYLSV